MLFSSSWTDTQLQFCGYNDYTIWLVYCLHTNVELVRKRIPKMGPKPGGKKCWEHLNIWLRLCGLYRSQLETLIYSIEIKSFLRFIFQVFPIIRSFRFLTTIIYCHLCIVFAQCGCVCAFCSRKWILLLQNMIKLIARYFAALAQLKT